MKVNKKMPIGVFDSGIGGLTVLYRLIEMFPHENFVFVGDTKNLPYGTKSKEQLKELVSNVSNYLVSCPVKSIVIACNTATANSKHLKETIDFPIVGVIEPTAKYALTISENILVLATNVTIDSNEYQDIINKYKHNTNSKQYYLKCSEFVDAIEANDIDTSHSYELVRNKLEKYENENIDVIILGCTHFGLYSKEIKKVFPNATLVECAIPTGKELEKQLKENDLLTDSVKDGKVKINVTKAQDNFYIKTKWFDKAYDGCFEIDLNTRSTSKSDEGINKFLDKNGKVILLPSKFEKAKMIINYIGTKFPSNVHLTEQEVNNIIKSWIVSIDYGFIRRSLVDMMILNRTKDGKDYWKN